MDQGNGNSNITELLVKTIKMYLTILNHLKMNTVG